MNKPMPPPLPTRPAAFGAATPATPSWEPITITAQEAYEATHNGKSVTRYRPVEVPVFRRVGVYPGVPSIDPNYTFRAEALRELVWAIWPHDNGPWTPALLVGPQGSGKTSLAEQLAARCNMSIDVVNMNVGTSVAHLKGRKGAEQGRTTFVPGIATMAMENGTWLVLDEVSGVTPPVALVLFPILVPNGTVVLEDEQPPRYVNRHPDFRVIATDNTIGADQEATRFDFAGTSSEMNAALLDRFGSTIPLGYMAKALEFDTIKAKVPQIDDNHLEGMIRVAANVREGKAVGGFSTRMVLEWARRVAAGKLQPDRSIADANQLSMIVEAARPAFLDRMRSGPDRQSVLEIITRLFNIKGG